MDSENNISKKETEEVEDWRDEHGLPNFEYLQSLAVDGGPEALEKLRSIAEDIDAGDVSGATPDEIVQMIRLATERNEDEGPVVTT